jgi:hypothetical protein
VLNATRSKSLIGKSWSGADPSLRHDAPFVSLDHQCHDDPKRRTWRALLKPEPGEVTFASAHGVTFELIEKNGLKSKLREAGHKFAQPGQGAASSHSKLAAKQRQAEKTFNSKRNESDRRCLEIINRHEITSSEACLAQGIDLRSTMFYLASSFGEHLWDSSGPICAVIGIEAKKDQRCPSM